MRTLDTSRRLYDEARTVLAGGVSSNFRGSPAAPPLVVQRGVGPRIFDADGNSYVDYVLGLGPAILGHAPSAVGRAVAATLDTGQAFAGLWPGEADLARRLTRIVPCAERVRFTGSGTEADQLAIRLARAATGRRKIVKFEGHYHGWVDSVLASVRPALNEAGPRSAPVAVLPSRGQSAAAAEDLIILPWNDVPLLEAALAAEGKDVAAILMEPMMANTGAILPAPGYLEAVRRLCDARGIVLIFDEVITGFRIDLGGAQRRFGIIPDLAVFAKAIAGGFPLSCVAGKQSIMTLLEEGVMHGGTYNALPLAVAAGCATLDILAAGNGAAYRAMDGAGRRLMAGLAEMARRHGVALQVAGLPQLFNTAFHDGPPPTDYRSHARTDQMLLDRFVAALLEEGVRITGRGTWFLSTTHDAAAIEETLAAAERAFRRLCS